MFAARVVPFVLLLVLSSPSAIALHAQQGCDAPAAIPTAREVNMFREEQENDLGDAMAEHIQRNFRVIEDEELTGYLRAVGGRILKRMAPTGLRYQFFLVDLPVANAFTIPGARIYVSRKLVAFTRNEDELAGILAHEIGHVATRQLGVEMTRVFREVLGVTQVGDRDDIFDKYHRLIESTQLKSGAFGRSSREEQKWQIEADQVSAIAATRAGYTPEAFAAVFDRLTESEGKTGNWFTDFFGTTKPEQRRLREILKILPKAAAGCIDSSGRPSAESYRVWQTKVLTYSGLGGRESLTGVLSRIVLDPPLRPDLDQLKFSPDGKYLLAQDDVSIFVLLRDPLVPLFRIYAPEARLAQFTPDSKKVVFHTPGLRVEHWDIETESLSAAHEVVKRSGCLKTALSPDGQILACLESEFHVTLLDVPTGTTVFQKKSFYTPDPFEAWLYALLGILGGEDIWAAFIRMDFSPDGRYFLAAHDNGTLALDVPTRTTISLPGSMKRLIASGFVFVGSDRVVAIDGAKSVLMHFPSGRVLQRLQLGRQSVTAATAGDYLFLRPIKDYAVGVMDLSTGKIFTASKRAAADIYGDIAASERATGEISLVRIADQQRVDTVMLPVSPLGRLRASALSADMQWLAVSGRSRGAVWDLSTGDRAFHVRGFRGADFDSEDILFADFPKYEETERAINRLDPSDGQISLKQTIGEDEYAAQYGPYLLVRKPAKKEGTVWENMTLEVHDVHSDELLWSRRFPKEAPGIVMSSRHGPVLLMWGVASNGAKELIKQDPGLQARSKALKDKEGDYLLVILDAQSGKQLGTLFIETGKGSFQIEYVRVAGDNVVIADSQNRVLVYSLATGDVRGRMFGGRFEVSNHGGLLCVESERGRVDLYDLKTLQKLHQYAFSYPVSLMSFREDGERLFVLTSNQVAFLLDVSPAARRSFSASR